MKHTIAQQRDWIYRAVGLLSFNGGLVSMVTFVSFIHNSVGYVTGNISFAADAFANGNILAFKSFMLALLAFLFGSIVSGVIIPIDNAERGSNYNIALIFEIICIICGGIGLKAGFDSARYFLAIAMGIQNALTTYYGKSIIRTTHMTGTMTDLGIILGHWIRGNAVEKWRIVVYLSLLTGFFVGSVVGAIAYKFIGYGTLIISVLLCMIMLRFSHADILKNT
ncbi:YoaK family protein [Aquella oligotrophica]|uniref:DUF1275 domain-containing protein n=1 Tax=Aquella oligotrophica TaxID=2067065 RepID=A0A2I7N3D1_9NEIS|nr:YoaK family protein [Aquella oligotrophica]AUR50967.1 DUF1275 domain-containing protein [Aquella oligotrophica]